MYVLYIWSRIKTGQLRTYIGIILFKNLSIYMYIYICDCVLCVIRICHFTFSQPFHSSIRSILTMATNSTIERFVPQGPPSLVDDAPGWSNDASKGPICWKCRGAGVKAKSIKTRPFGPRSIS